MLRGRRAGIAAALAIAALAAVTAGCGGGSMNTSGALKLDPVSAAATKTQNAGAARIRFAMKLGSQGMSLPIRGTGVVDGSSVEMNLKLGSMLGAMGLPGANKATMAQLQHASLREIALKQNGDYVIYMRFPSFLSSQLPGGKQWMKLDMTKLGKSAGVDFSQLMSSGQFDPSDLLSMLQAEGAKVQKVGPATIDGAATTRYNVNVDVAKALQSKGVKSPLLSGIASKMKSVNEKVWIGNDGLLRRVAFAENVPAGPARANVGMTMDMFDYGAHVTIAAPPSSQVFDATQQVAQNAGGTY